MNKIILLSLLLAISTTNTYARSLEIGDILVTSDGIDSSVTGVLLFSPNGDERIWLTNGDRGEGPNLERPRGVGATGNGSVYVADSGLDAIFYIDPVTGNRSIISDETRGTGPLFIRPRGIEVIDDNNILVADRNVGIINVDITTGDRSILLPGSGFYDLTVAADGNIYYARGSSIGWYDPATDLNHPIPNGFPFPEPDDIPQVHPLQLSVAISIAIGNDGSIFVADIGGSEDGPPGIKRVDPLTGENIMHHGTGPEFFIDPESIAVDPSGDFIVTALETRTYRVLAENGNRQLLGGAVEEGLFLSFGSYVVLVPEPGSIIMLLTGILGFTAIFRRKKLLR